MLSESDYFYAMAVYIAAGTAALAWFFWSFRSVLGRRVRATLVLVAAALLLTPAFPQPGVETMAPALVVAVFQFATEGVEAAMHALRPLGVSLLVAVVLSLLVAVIWRPRPAA